jgi:PAS domain S-box-containing protein
MARFKTIFRAFIVAIAATVLMAVMRLFVFVPVFEFSARALPCILAIMLAAWIGGLMSGLFATVFNAGLLLWAVAGEIELQVVPISDQLRIVLICIIGGLISWGIESLHISGRRVEERQRKLEGEIRRREQVEATLREQEERIRLAVEAADLGTWDLNPITGEQQWSSRAKLMCGLSADADVSSFSFREKVHPEDREQVNHALQKAFDPSGNGLYEIDFRIVWPDNTVHWLIARGQVLFEGEKAERRAFRLIGTGLDITARKQSEESIRVSQARLKAMMDNTSAVIYLKDMHGRHLMVNRRFEELFSVTEQQIAGKTDADIFPDDVVAQLEINDRQVRETGQALEFEEVVPQADGPHTYFSVKFPIFDSAGQVAAVGGISTDISDRKKAADALEVEREMLRHTIEVQDQQRQLIAYEIHDGLVQYATGALMQLESIRNRTQSGTDGEQLDKVLGVLKKTIDEGRRIINGIHTTILDDCGVVAAVQQLIGDEDRANVQVEFIRDEALGRMAPNVELALYHITQEALTNAHKHSKSDRVRVKLSRHEDRVHLEVRDWGMGFAPPKDVKGVHGLRGMAERARIAGGKCTIRNAGGKGTQVIVDLPYLSRNDESLLI